MHGEDVSRAQSDTIFARFNSYPNVFLYSLSRQLREWGNRRISKLWKHHILELGQFRLLVFRLELLPLAVTRLLLPRLCAVKPVTEYRPRQVLNHADISHHALFSGTKRNVETFFGS